jgi:hypothetical protein
MAVASDTVRVIDAGLFVQRAEGTADNEQAWRNLIASHHMDWFEYIDRDGQILAIFEINVFPTLVVLDRDGRTEFRPSRLCTDTESQLANAITSALREPHSREPPYTPAMAPASLVVSMTEAPAPAVDDASATATSQCQVSLLPLRAALIAKASSVAASVSAQVSKFIFPPDDVENGDAAEGIYRNDFLGLSYRFPQSWIPRPPKNSNS